MTNLTPEQNKYLTEWYEVTKRISNTEMALVEDKRREKELRTTIGRQHFAAMPGGTHRKAIGGGCSLKGVIDTKYTINKDPDGSYTSLSKVLTQLPHMASNLVRWTPELSVTNYKTLTKEEQALLDSILTITNSDPKIEIELPKIVVS